MFGLRSGGGVPPSCRPASASCGLRCSLGAAALPATRITLQVPHAQDTTNADAQRLPTSASDAPCGRSKVADLRFGRSMRTLKGCRPPLRCVGRQRFEVLPGPRSVRRTPSVRTLKGYRPPLRCVGRLRFEVLPGPRSVRRTPSVRTLKGCRPPLRCVGRQRFEVLPGPRSVRRTPSVRTLKGCRPPLRCVGRQRFEVLPGPRSVRRTFERPQDPERPRPRASPKKILQQRPYYPHQSS